MKLFAVGLVLAAVLALPAAAATPEMRTITVVGNGEAEAETPSGEWTLVVSVDNERARTALRSATAAVSRVRAALRAAGVTDFHADDVAIAARTAQAPDDNTSFRGFVASAEIEFTLADAQRAATLLDRVRTAGVAAIYGPAPAEDTSHDLERRALADGMDDAVEKAKRLAAKAGVTLGAAVTIEERRQESPYGLLVYGPGGPFSRGAPSDDVYASVTVTFAVS